MAAAIRAHDLGAKTLVVEEAARYGGSTALSGGVAWVPNNPLMRAAGIEDSAEEGLATYRKNAPDLIICDLMMEEVDAGTSLVKELKALGNQVPIFMLTSTGDSMNMTVQASDLGLSGILQKPIDSESLLALLRAKLS